MDFIEGLPANKGKNAILVVFDRLSKYGHFVPIAHPYTASQVAEVFMREIFRLHGMPRSIVSDRDPTFTSQFWTTFFALQGTKLCHSLAYHPQSDGQIEVLNRTLEHYLRCYVDDKPTTWIQWFPWVEWWYNTTYHSTIKMTPFQAVYGQPPPSVDFYSPGSTVVVAVDLALRERETLLRHLRHNMQVAQERMSFFANHKRTEGHFAVGDWVFLRLQPYHQALMGSNRCLKLSPRFYGPYKVVARIGSVTYKLELPQGSRIHNVFHVSLLTKKIGDKITPSSSLPPMSIDGSPH
ncbi:unnamed protein product [Prunus brigantina]